jgi:hypothetical protein
MVCFQTKNPNLGKFWRPLDWKKFVYFWPFGLFYGDLGYFMTICAFCIHLVHFSDFGIMYEEKSGNPGLADFFRHHQTSDR